MIFYRKVVRNPAVTNGHQNGGKGDPVSTGFEQRINEAVFPGLQGGPHNNTIAAMAVALKEAASPEFVHYQEQVVENMRQLCTSLMEFGYKIVTGGSDTHVCLVDLRPSGIDGNRVDKTLELVGITVNKNTCPGDPNALRPSGIRIGTPALTTRGLKTKDFQVVASFLHEGIQIALEAKRLARGKLLKDFLEVLNTNESVRLSMTELHRKVEEFAIKFSLPGFDF